jgi:hypothetical protein
MRKTTLVVAAGILVSVGAVVWARNGDSSPGEPGSLLRQWSGRDCVCYLRMESDPRAGRASFNSNTADGLHETSAVPISITGTITGVSDDGITIANGNTVYWVSREQIRVIAGALAANR